MNHLINKISCGKWFLPPIYVLDLSCVSHSLFLITSTKVFLSLDYNFPSFQSSIFMACSFIVLYWWRFFCLFIQKINTFCFYWPHEGGLQIRKPSLWSFILIKMFQQYFHPLLKVSSIPYLVRYTNFKA